MDRTFRILSGSILIGVGLLYEGEFLSNYVKIISLVLGAYSLITGAINFCPLTYLISSEKKLKRRLSRGKSISAISDKAKDLTFFGDLKQGDIQKILSLCTVGVYKEEEKIMEEGEYKKKLYIVYSGEVKVAKEIDNGECKTIATLEDGEVFGEMSFFDNLPPCASVIAVSKTKVLEIDIMDFLRIMNKDKNLAIKIMIKFLKAESARIRSLNEEIASMGKWLMSSRGRTQLEQ